MRFMRRRRFLINRSLQFPLLWNSLSHVLLFVVVTVVSLFLPSMIELRNLEDYSDKTVQAANQILYLHDYFWPSVLFVLIAIFLDSIRVSHKIAGPLICFTRAFEAIGKGELPAAIRIRKGDYLVEEAEAINRMLGGLRENVRAIQETHAVLRETLSGWAEAGKESSSTEMEDRVKDLVEKADQLEERIQYFKVAL
jgi:nitrogen fixation/metabolism regulation signal transduction histidine kinase